MDMPMGDDSRTGQRREQPPTSVRSLLGGSPLRRLETLTLLQHVLGVSRAWLIAHDTDPPEPTRVRAFEALRARRLQGAPMGCRLGSRESMGHCFAVEPGVLI